MTSRVRGGTRKRVLLTGAGVLLAGLLGAIPAYGQTGSGTTDLTSTGITTGTSTTGTSDTGTTTLTSTGLTSTLTSTTLTADLSSTTLTADLTSTGLTTGSSSPTAPSADTQIIYSPYPVPVYGDYGHRYYGQYWDSGCGCDRYASPSYTPQTVVASQVASVPKGGVDTGDGTFP